MNRIVNIKFGAHLYGTVTPSSDLDYKSVYIPDARAILLQRVQAATRIQRAKAEKEKNFPGEIEEESYSLQKYLALAAEGQTVALDVLFAPEWSMTEPPSEVWRELVANRAKIVTKRSAAFIGYCRQQANKYGIKGSRVAAARKALELLNGLVKIHGSTPKLGEFADDVAEAASGVEHMVVTDIPLASASLIRHWDVCGRKLPYTSSIKNARDIVQRLVDEYGQRALQAESQQGVDWKALSHAVRVGTQAIELLQTGHVTFPLPNAEHVLAIKTGSIAYQDVAAEIEGLLVAVEAEAERSSLPATPDTQWIDDFVARVYKEVVCRT